MSINLSSTTSASLARRFHSAVGNPDRSPSDLIQLSVALLASVFLGPVSRARQLLLAFEYDGTTPARSMEIFNLVAEDGVPLPDDQLRRTLQGKYGELTLQDMLRRAACEHLDHESPGWRGEKGTEGYLSFGIAVDEQGYLSVQPAATVTLISGEDFLERSPPAVSDPNVESLLHRPGWEAARVSQLAEVYRGLAADEFTPVQTLLEFAAAILLKAAAELFPERAFASAAFEFEGDSEATRVEIVSFDDEDDRLICSGAILGRWQPQSGTTVSHVLCEAVFRYLDARVPEWQAGPGAEGHVRLAISWDDARRIKVDTTGRARIWTRVDRVLSR